MSELAIDDDIFAFDLTRRREKLEAIVQVVTKLVAQIKEMSELEDNGNVAAVMIYNRIDCSYAGIDSVGKQIQQHIKLNDAYINVWRTHFAK